MKTPVISVVQRPEGIDVGTVVGSAMAAVVANLSEVETEKVLEKEVEQTAHLMSDGAKALVAVGQTTA